MANGILKDYLDSAWAELRKDVERARASGEKAVQVLQLNGVKDQLPSGVALAIEEVRGLYLKANEAAEKVMIGHLGATKDRMEAIRRGGPPPPQLSPTLQAACEEVEASWEDGEVPVGESR